MNNFTLLFVRLKNERGLSTKQIASFTGADLKDVKKWESGSSVPTDKKIIAALEGLLGKEISQNMTTSDLNIVEKTDKKIEESLFKVDKYKDINLKSGIFNRFKSDTEKKQKKNTTEMDIFDVYPSRKKDKDEETINIVDLYETALDEKPYIRDPKQLFFYFSRNIKTFFAVSILLYIASKALQLFINSFNQFINNIL